MAKVWGKNPQSLAKASEGKIGVVGGDVENEVFDEVMLEGLVLPCQGGYLRFFPDPPHILVEQRLDPSLWPRPAAAIGASVSSPAPA